MGANSGKETSKSESNIEEIDKLIKEVNQFKEQIIPTIIDKLKKIKKNNLSESSESSESSDKKPESLPNDPSQPLVQSQPIVEPKPNDPSLQSANLDRQIPQVTGNKGGTKKKYKKKNKKEK